MPPGQAARESQPIDRARLQAIIDHVHAGLIERESQARCLVLAALCGEHALFIGPPGTAKSELARRLHGVTGGRFFERLLTRFTVPEELFGPLSLAALDDGRYERDIEGYLPTATVAFLDEVFKANSAILNALLTLLNEREFDQGAVRLKTPLLSVVAASNEVPEDEALRAFYDRFLLRCPVDPVSPEGFESLLAAGAGAQNSDPVRLDPAEVLLVQRHSETVRVPAQVTRALIDLRALLVRESITVSDRRWVRVVRALRVAAWANGRDSVALSDLWVLQFMVCERPAQLPLVRDWLTSMLGAAQALDPQWLARVVQAFDKQLELEASASELAFDDSGKLALMRSVGGADDQAMSSAAPRLSAFSRRKHYSASHIGARLAQIDGVAAEVDGFLARGSAHVESIRRELDGNLWVAAAYVRTVLQTLTSNLDKVEHLRIELGRVRAEFAALPLATHDDGRIPDEVVADEA